MNPIVLTGFAGAALEANPRLLDERVGVDVVDARPIGGDLRPLKLPVTVATVPAGTQRKTIYRMGRDTPSDANYWLQWTTEVSVARGFDGQDTTERTYYTGDGSPKWTNNVIGLGGGPPYPQAARELSVPTPTGAPAVVMDTDGSGTEMTRSYVVTFVNDLGWESAPSAPSNGLLAKDGAIIDINAIPQPPPGNYGITQIRIYRTQTGETNVGSFFLLRTVSVGTTTSEDDARSLGGELATVGWIPPPTTGHHILGLWNGMFAMLDGHRLLFNEPNIPPYTFPIKYDRAIDDLPVALAKWEQNLLVLTTGKPKLFQGQDSAGMSESGAGISYACASSRSVVSFEHGVVWASNEGLAYAGNGGNKLLTEGILTPDQWKAYNPSTMVAGRYGRLYVCTKNNGASGFMFDPLAPQMGLWFLSYGWDACWYDELQDALYILQGAVIKRFDAGAAGTCSYTSKQFHQRGPRNLPRAKVTADTYPLTFKLYAESVLKFTKTVLSEKPFTLPNGYGARDFQIKVEAVPASLQGVVLGDIDDMRA